MATDTSHRSDLGYPAARNHDIVFSGLIGGPDFFVTPDTAFVIGILKIDDGIHIIRQGLVAFLGGSSSR